MAIEDNGYIIPSRFYRGELGKLREDDIEAWRGLVAQSADTRKVVGSNPTVSTWGE